MTGPVQPLRQSRIGVLGGTFDPIHLGHLVAASEASAALCLDEVIFVPTGDPWHKAATVRLPVAVWREAMDVHFPGQAWLRVSRPTFDRLSVYRGRHGMVSFDQALERLMEEADE